MSDTKRADHVHRQVREGYGEIARAARAASAGDEGGCGRGGCCGGAVATANEVAKAVGYAASDLDGLPEGANLGLSCGNPTALAALEPGEVVLDLGSGAGLDCFIAGPRVGAEGRVIGVDMTSDMLGKARDAIADYERLSGLANVEFRLGEIEHLPVGDHTVDVVISNCVVNLAPDKDQVWREIARVLAPGGRVAVSDLALLKPLPPEIVADLEALLGCVAGAQLIDDVRQAVEQAGLTDIELTPKPQYMDAMRDLQDPLYQRIASTLPDSATLGEYVVSLDIAARKPA